MNRLKYTRCIFFDLRCKPILTPKYNPEGQDNRSREWGGGEVEKTRMYFSRKSKIFPHKLNVCDISYFYRFYRVPANSLSIYKAPCFYTIYSCMLVLNFNNHINIRVYFWFFQYGFKKKKPKFVEINECNLLQLYY